MGATSTSLYLVVFPMMSVHESFPVDLFGGLRAFPAMILSENESR